MLTFSKAISSFGPDDEFLSSIPGICNTENADDLALSNQDPHTAHRRTGRAAGEDDSWRTTTADYSYDATESLLAMPNRQRVSPAGDEDESGGNGELRGLSAASKFERGDQRIKNEGQNRGQMG